MKIRNKHTSAIGFGSVTVLPDTTGELPREFDANHPVLKYYISRGWVEIADGAPTAPEAARPVAVNIAPPAPKVSDEAGDAGDSAPPHAEGSGNEDGKDGDGEKPDDAKKAGAPKSLSRMNLDELRALAEELGLEFTETDTRPTLIDKITAAKEANK
jgi:hypothetical protein